MRDSDLRSLNRPRLYEVFAPLDPDERLPRELVLEKTPGVTWGLRIGRQHIAGTLWLPASLATFGLVFWFAGDVVYAFASVGLLLAGFSLFAFSRRAR